MQLILFQSARIIAYYDLQRKVLKDAGNSREVNLDLVHLTMMLKNTANSRKVGHNLQRKVLKDASNSREVDLDLVHLTMMLKNATNLRKVDHDLQRKVLKDATNQRKVGHDPQRKVLTTTVGLKYHLRCQ